MNGFHNGVADGYRKQGQTRRDEKSVNPGEKGQPQKQTKGKIGQLIEHQYIGAGIGDGLYLLAAVAQVDERDGVVILRQERHEAVGKAVLDQQEAAARIAKEEAAKKTGIPVEKIGAFFNGLQFRCIIGTIYGYTGYCIQATGGND